MNDQERHYLDKLSYEIDSWDLKVGLDAADKITVVDTRSKEAYGQRHIPGAINIPHRTMTPETTSTIDQADLVVTYCDGIGCNGSTRGALKMLRLGFKVRELIGGLDWWVRDGHPTHGTDGTESSGSCGCG